MVADVRTQKIMSFQLNSGGNIPAVGLGTWQAEPGKVGEAVKTAIGAGYRHIDCAAAYNNQKEVGEALHYVLKNGIVKREDLFITTKLWNTEHEPEEVPVALDRCLRDLQLDYVDLYLMHWPVQLKKGAPNPPRAQDFAPLDIKATWQAMERLVPPGKVKAIGVSNFSVTKLKNLLSYAHIVPAVNQVECHPMWQQRKLKLELEDHNIHLTGYSPLGSSGSLFVGLHLLEQPVIKALAEKYHKSPGQVALRWGVQQGHSVIPKSTQEARLKSNVNIFDFSLSDEDLEKISGMTQIRFLRGEEWTNQTTSPFKGALELWDGEV